jgi:hypothetical protein
LYTEQKRRFSDDSDLRPSPWLHHWFILDFRIIHLNQKHMISAHFVGKMKRAKQMLARERVSAGLPTSLSTQSVDIGAAPRGTLQQGLFGLRHGR